MSPASPTRTATDAASVLVNRLSVGLGSAVREARLRRGWSIRELAARARLSPAALYRVEVGGVASLDTYARISVALGASLALTLERRRPGTTREPSDVVHAAMGEMEAARLTNLGYTVAIDEPYQHYQFAGRADVLAWRLEPPALLHIENRTRYPDVQDALGSFSAKRRYLPDVMAARLGLRHGFGTVTHVMAGLWSSEVIHTLRTRSATFRAIFPDGSEAFDAWWAGEPPRGGESRTFLLLDPLATGRQKTTLGLASALVGARPRVRGYREAAEALRRIGRA